MGIIRAQAGSIGRPVIIWSGRMRQAPETIVVETTRVGCDGGGGALGHPLVYLTVGKEGRTDCPYCSRQFVLSDTAKVGTHGH
jgi:uncharacterized Zn-finger protein